MLKTIGQFLKSPARKNITSFWSSSVLTVPFPCRLKTPEFMYLGLIFTDTNILILGNTGQSVRHVAASRCHSGNLRCPWIQLSDCSADCLQDHIANTDFSHPIAGVVFWPALAYSPAKYLHCRLFFFPNVLLLLVCMFLR